MKFQKNNSGIKTGTKTAKFMGMGIVGLSAALLIGLPSSAQGSAQGNSDSSSGGYANPGQSPAGSVDSPSDSVNYPTNPNYGEPQDGSTTSGFSSDAMRSDSTQPTGGEVRGPSAVGEGFPGPSEAPAGSPSSGTSIEDPTRRPSSNRDSSTSGTRGDSMNNQQMAPDDEVEGPSAVGEGFPGPSEAPAGSPSSGTSIEDPTRAN
ncbi:MAG: hypothetical protein KME07_00900 [Pegethrix bostrychoides GSE-TBD4-15B]|jgi:hypothetical protein|uniref:Uncharacterized protein n=1 Tax=Pegethrix bostrychoides GSE-TBD4-15B TaxID=2839662 RepID=A0A951P7V0_9CYAN|nr:hypothetical protein [Pegethrix bostrychoides GSE-TBD4-15B]